jgi:hypothetical protein
MEARLKLATIKTLLTISFIFVLMVAFGCSQRDPIAPVSGRVTIDGEPLPFGYVVFQPQKGQPAKGEISEEGRFSLISAKLGEGALLGKHRVSVYCYEGHSPEAKEKVAAGHVSLGRSLIPVGYSRGGMSGLSAEVPPDGLEDFQIELSSKGPSR